MPRTVRWAVFGAILLGLPGALAGLVIGLHTYAPTAWAATFEVAGPAALLGATLGAAGAAVTGRNVARDGRRRDRAAGRQG